MLAKALVFTFLLATNSAPCLASQAELSGVWIWRSCDNSAGVLLCEKFQMVLVETGSKLCGSYEASTNDRENMFEPRSIEGTRVKNSARLSVKGSAGNIYAVKLVRNGNSLIWRTGEKLYESKYSGPLELIHTTIKLRRSRNSRLVEVVKAQCAT